ncbi:MAG TPA: AMMECR1 domain-containing protein, partial [Firmicutes bacterium]|nr:AMMECR1 domain-containing protein [Bacillota bacterium]
VENLSEIKIGRDGLVIEQDVHKGLLLPQVATEHGLDVPMFLSQTCIKAGLPPDAWKHGANIYRFPAEVF